MLDSVKATLNQTASHPIVLTTALIYSAKASFHETSGHPLIIWSILILVLAHAVIKNIFFTFKRDAHSKTFKNVSDAASLLSNPDSVLGRDGVKESIINYETLYSGARQEHGTTSTNDSIEKRANEYQNLVNR